MPIQSSILQSSRFAVITFITLGIVYLASCWIPKEWNRTLIDQRSIIDSLRQGYTQVEHGNYSVVNSAVQLQNDNHSTGKRAQFVMPIWNNLTPFDRFLLKGQIQGTGDIILRFGQQHYSVQSYKDSKTGKFVIRGEVLQDTSPELVVLGADPGHSVPGILVLKDFQLRGEGFRSYGHRILPLFLLSFLWILLVLSSRDKKATIAALGMIIILYAAIRLSYVLHIQEMPFSDMADYERIALGLLEGKEHGHNPFFQSFYAHGLPYYVAAVYYLFGLKNMLALKLINVFLGLIATLAIYFCGRLVSGFKAGLIGAFLFTFSHEMTFWSAKLSTEHLFACISMIALYCVLKAWKQNQVYWFLLSGIMLGYLFFIRSILHFFLLPLFVGFLFFHPAKFRIILWHGIVFLFGFLLVLSPWIIRGYERYGELMLTGTGGWFSFVHQNNDIVQPGEFGGREIQVFYQRESPKRFDNDLDAAKWVQQDALKWVKTHPWRYLQLSIGRFQMLFMKQGIALTKTSPTELNFLSNSYYYLFHWNAKPKTALAWLALGALLIWLIQLFFQVRSKKSGDIFFQNIPLIYLCGMSLMYLLTLSFPRYRDPLLPVIYLIIGMGVASLIQWGQSKWKRYL
ncbi:MAG: glycosyltransferase family 39 protein [SAR324 cluster bacterium]|nr:glycosyltransferase family 39 protein [SAR324 cluster bacterium]